jgi:hypothetical protein
MATLREHFHRDPDGLGAAGDARYAISVSAIPSRLVSYGPLPGQRTAYVTPGVTWQSVVDGPGFYWDPITGESWYSDRQGIMLDAGRSYDAGSRTTLDWLRRPLHPGPVGAAQGASSCQPTPVQRSADTMYVWLAGSQDGPDRFSCSTPQEAMLRLERDGTQIGEVDAYYAAFRVPPEAATYRLTYEQTADRPYADHRSGTTWTFRSAAPPRGTERLPLLVVDYDLPLDPSNRPTGRTATFTVDQVTGVEPRPIERLRVWTSTDDGTTWQQAEVRRQEGGRSAVRLPRVDEGTQVSLRVDARDADGNRIEQTLYDAYTT